MDAYGVGADRELTLGVSGLTSGGVQLPLLPIA